MFYLLYYVVAVDSSLISLYRISLNHKRKCDIVYLLSPLFPSLIILDVTMSPQSRKYVQYVQDEFCQYLLRSARRTFHRGGNFPNYLANLVSLGSQNSRAVLATAAAADRLSLLLRRLTEVKHMACGLENFLVERYYAEHIPNKSLLTEMLLTKRQPKSGNPSASSSASSGSQPHPHLHQPPPSVPPPSIGRGGFEYNYSTPPPPNRTVPVKHDPHVYTPSVHPSDWRPQSAGGGGGDGYHQGTAAASGTPGQYYAGGRPPSTSDFLNAQPPPPPSLAPVQTSQGQDQSFFMPPSSQSATTTKQHQ